MSLFSPPLAYDDKLMEGTVTNVDPIRFVCSVKTVRGQYLNEVSWLLPTGGSGKSGVHFAPNIGDQVVISTGLTYPVIIGALPRLGTRSTALTNVAGSLPMDAGNNTNMKNGYATNPDKPADFTPGDHMITNESGGILGLLANGSFIMRASALAQIFASKFDDLVRIVARNFERFSDVGQQTAANVKGRMYDYFGWDRDLNRSKNGIYELQEVVGDVVAGETLKGEPNTTTVLPVADTRVHKRWLTNVGGQNVMVEVMKTDGSIEVTVTNPANSENSDVLQKNNQFDSKVTANGGVAEFVQNGNNASNTVTNGGAVSTTVLDGSKWESSMTNGTFSKVTLTPSSAVVTYNGTSSVTLNSSSAILSFSGGGTGVCNSSGVHFSFGSHFIDVTSAGVNIG